jgi:hypothetical protein
MSASLPDWLAPPPESHLPVWSPPAPRVELGNRALPLPDWLSGSPRDKTTSATKALLFQQYEMVTPRVFELVCAGYTLSNAIKEISYKIDQGAYMTWLKRQPEMYAMFKEAKEVRTEVWAGEIIRHATAEETEEGKPYLHDTSRPKNRS